MPNIRIKDIPTTASATSSTDFIGIDGSANGTRKLNAYSPTFGGNVTASGNLTVSGTTGVTATDLTLGSSGPSVKSSLSARAPRQGLVFDGSGTKATVTLPAFGTGDFTASAWVREDNSFAGTPIVMIGSGVGGFYMEFDANGFPYVAVQGGAGVQRKATTACVVKKLNLITYVKTSGTGIWYVNGIAAGSDTDSNNYTVGVATFSDSSPYNLTGFLSPLIYNRALSASEVVALYEAGAPAGADYNSASNTNAILNVSRNSDFSAGATDWGSLNGATISVVSSTLNVVASAAGQVASLASSYFGGNFKVGKRYRLTFTVSNFSSGDTLRVSLGGSNQVVADAVNPNGTYTYEWTASGSDGTFLFFSPVNSARTYNLDNIAIYPLGLLLAPDAAQAGGGLVWYDTSGNAANITLPASGVSWNVPSSRVLGGNWTTSGNLTVSGTGLSSVAGAMKVGGTATFTGAGLELQYVAGGGNYGYFRNYNRTSSVYERLYVDGFLTILNSDSGGNVLIGTTTDSGNGKLQLATHTTSAGGIGFGTDTSLYRGASGIGTLELSASSGTVSIFKVALAGAAKAQFGIAAGATYIDYDGSLVVRNGIGGTTALGLDSSQNATFAGTVVGKLYGGTKTATVANAGNGDIAVSATAGMAVVRGSYTGGGVEFRDVVLWAYYGSTPTVIASQNVGSVPTRTYSIAGGSGLLNVALASGQTGNYDIYYSQLGN